jgi:superfamily II DNA or RNA helicase
MFIAEAFQRTAINTIATRFARYKRVLLQSATGSGKTVMAVIFIQEWMEANPGKNVLCLFNLQCLLPQFEASFKFQGLRDKVSLFHDLITRAKDGSRMVDHQADTSRPIMLTMPETLANALKGAGSKDLTLDAEWVENVGLILIDEAHKGTSENFQYIRDAIDAPVLGLTATPMRVKNKEGECLANDWEYELVTTVSIRELIEMERLVAPLYYDLDEDAHLFREWQKAVEKHSALDGNKQTIWFCRDTAHAKEWEAKLLEVGETCRVITSVDDADLGTTSQTPNQREVIYKEFEAQEITHLISIQALCEGFDAPIAKYCVIDRGIGNKALYQQILGRVLRIFKGKLNGHILDRCGNRARHGDIEDYVWDLDVEAADAVVVKLGAKREISEEQMERATKVMVKCETHQCPSVYNAKNNLHCPHCKTEHGLQVEVPALLYLQDRFPDMPVKMILNLIPTFQKALAGDVRATSLLLNHMNHIFDEDGNISERFQGLYKIAAMKVRNEKELKKATIRWAA